MAREGDCKKIREKFLQSRQEWCLKGKRGVLHPKMEMNSEETQGRKKDDWGRHAHTHPGCKRREMEH